MQVLQQAPRASGPSKCPDFGIMHEVIAFIIDKEALPSGSEHAEERMVELCTVSQKLKRQFGSVFGMSSYVSTLPGDSGAKMAGLLTLGLMPGEAASVLAFLNEQRQLNG